MITDKDDVKIKKRIVSFLIIFIAALPSITCAEVFYVRPKGTSSLKKNNGLSYEQAWVGFTNIKWGTGKEDGKIDSGDTLYICGTHKEPLNLDHIINYTKSIVIRGDYDLEPGIIDAENSVNNVVIGKTIKNVKFASLEIKNCTKTAMNLYDSSHITENRNIQISNMKIHDIKGNAIALSGDNVTITNCEIYDIGVDGIYARGRYLTVTNCKIYKVAQSPTELGDCIQISTRSGDFYIAHNKLTNLSKNAKQCFIVHSKDTGGIFEHNTCEISTEKNQSHFPIQVKQKDVIVRSNTFKGGNYCGVFLFGDIYCNIFENATHCGIRILPSKEGIIGNVEICYNVIQNCKVGVFHSSKTVLQLHNNIILDSKDIGVKITEAGQSSAMIQSNRYINNQLDVFGVTTSKDKSDITFKVDPNKRGKDLLENSYCPSL